MPRHLSALLGPDDIPEGGEVVLPDGRKVTREEILADRTRALSIPERQANIAANIQQRLREHRSQAQLGLPREMTDTPPPHEAYEEGNFVTITSGGVAETRETFWDKLGRLIACICCCIRNGESAFD